MGELTRQQKKDFAKSLYMGDPTITQKEIARRVGTTEKTLGGWIKDEMWKEQRTSLVGSRDEQLAWLYSQITAIKRAVETRARKAKEDGIEGEPCVTSREADTITKLTNSIKKLETETNVSDIVEVGKRFLVFLRQIDPDKALEYMPLYDAFVKELSPIHI